MTVTQQTRPSVPRKLAEHELNVGMHIHVVYLRCPHVIERLEPLYIAERLPYGRFLVSTSSRNRLGAKHKSVEEMIDPYGNEFFVIDQDDLNAWRAHLQRQTCSCSLSS